ncbi:MAG: BrnT family toxin [Eubacterium sp.]|nr:BrnT family toxin [Eubacterium sp.]
MNGILFEWDDNKNKINITKHGVNFEEAKTVFDDDNAIVFDDPDHSVEEDRFLILGISKYENLCIVSHCYRNKDEIIRIISARKATKKETEIYYEYAGGNDYER